MNIDVKLVAELNFKKIWNELQINANSIVHATVDVKQFILPISDIYCHTLFCFLFFTEIVSNYLKGLFLENSQPKSILHFLINLLLQNVTGPFAPLVYLISLYLFELELKGF